MANVSYAKVEGGKVTNMIMADGSLLPAGTWIPVETDSGNIYMKPNQVGTVVDHGVIGSNWDGSTMELDADIITKAEQAAKLNDGIGAEEDDAIAAASNWRAREENIAAIRTAFANINIDFDDLAAALDEVWGPRDKTHKDGDLLKSWKAKGYTGM